MLGEVAELFLVTVLVTVVGLTSMTGAVLAPFMFEWRGFWCSGSGSMGRVDLGEGVIVVDCDCVGVGDSELMMNMFLVVGC